jgi:hypothetical protein
VSEHKPDHIMDYSAISRETGITVHALRTRKWAGTMLPPDRYIGRSPVWRWETIRPWVLHQLANKR